MESPDYDVNQQYTKLTFTPTQADRFVLAFRNWLRRHGKSQPEWFGSFAANQPLPSTVLTKREVSKSIIDIYIRLYTTYKTCLKMWNFE